MKKKLIALALTLLLVCTLFTACGESAFSIISSAVEKTENLDSMAVQMKLEMNMAMEGMTLSIPLTANIKAKDIKSDAPVTFAEVSMTMLGQSVDVEMYQEGDWAYMVMGDMKYKANVADADSEYDYTDEVNAMLQAIPEDLLENVEMVKGDDGSASATISIPDEVFAEIYSDFIDSVGESAGMEGTEITISDAVVRITVANGYVSVYDMEYTMEMTVSGVSATTEVKASATYDNPGEEVTITPPEGYADFEELDMTGLA